MDYATQMLLQQLIGEYFALQAERRRNERATQRASRNRR
jgi:hypothetical protein